MNYKYFVQQGSTYTSKPLAFGALILAIIWGIIAAYFIKMGLESTGLLKNWYWIVAFIGMLLSLKVFLQRTVIDLAAGTISTSFVGLMKKECKLSDISDFETLKHIYIVFHNGTDIIINTTTNKQIKIFERVGSTKKVTAILTEINQIIPKR